MSMGGGAIGWSISRPVSVMVGVILVVLFGFLSIAGIPIQLTPDVTSPVISVTTLWPGATPKEIESEILEGQEKALKRLTGLVKMTSTARRDNGSITLEMRVGSSIDEALVRVSNLLSQVPNHPLTARQPVISTASSTGPPLAVLIIQSIPPGREVAEYRTWVDEVIVSRLERIKGVASIRLIGGREQEVHIDFDPAALAARGITVSRLAAAVRANLVDVSAGDIPIGKRRLTVRTTVAPKHPKDLERIVLKVSKQDMPVLLGDVAKVRFGLRKAEAVGMVDGSPSMALLLFREAGSNVLDVTQKIRKRTAELQQNYLAPEGLELTIVADQVDYIQGALRLVRTNLIIGGLLAILVLLVFLRSFGASAVVALSIPISIIGTVLVMSLMGRTINIVSLAGMAFAVGMVVDNSIVVLENIDTWRRKETNVAKASLLGAQEVWGAILASTITTAVVFIPIITWQDEVGELLRDIAVAVSAAVIVSLIVSVLVIPSLAARMLSTKKSKHAKPTEDDTADGPANHGVIGGSVHWIVRSRLRAIGLALAGIGAASLVGLTLVPSMEYLPKGNRNIVFGVLIPPPGYSVEEMRRIGERIQRKLVKHTGKEVGGVPSLRRSFFVGSPDQAFMGGAATDPKQVAGVAKLIRQTIMAEPDVFGFASQGSLFGRRLGGGRSIEIDISGPDLKTLGRLGGMLFGMTRKALPGAQVRPIPGLDPGAEELQVEPRRDKTERYGMTGAQLGLLVDAYIDGAIIGQLGRSGEPKRDVVLRAIGIKSKNQLLTAPAATPTGDVVIVGKLAKITPTLGPTVIQRIERRRAITLQVAAPDNIALEDAIAKVRNEVVGPLRASGKIPPGTRVDISGSAGRLEQAKTRFGWVLLLAVIITFLVLAALFEDFLAPIAILVTIPLAGAGGVLGLLAVDKFLGKQPLDMLTAVGFLVLIGVVVNNAILIVDGALTRMRRDGMELADAVASAVQWRVRPIMMSALTSIAGLLPLVLFPGSGSELYRGIGGVVLGGLALSTFLSIFIVPALFTSLWRVRMLVMPRPT